MRAGLLLDRVLARFWSRSRCTALRMGARGCEVRGLSIARNSSLRRCRSANAAACSCVCPLQAAAFADVPDVALGDVPLVHLIDVADELDFDLLAALGFERQVVVADVALLLQFSVGGFVRRLVSEQADLPEFLAQELVVRVAQQSVMNGLASMIFPVSASRIRMPSLAVWNSRRYRTSESASATSARLRSVMSSMASRISSGWLSATTRSGGR